jgi:hypothetical protein
VSDFFISGFSDSGVSALSAPTPLELRASRLTAFAEMEFARFEFGMQDAAAGKLTQAARDLVAANRRVGRLSHPRARQRAQAYVPIEGREHCPHCWVFTGRKHLLRFVPADFIETASCSECTTHYQLARG